MNFTRKAGGVEKMSPQWSSGREELKKGGKRKIAKAGQGSRNMKYDEGSSGELCPPTYRGV